MDEERDLIIFTNEDGQEIEMEVLDYFEYEDEVYAMLVEADAMDQHDHEHGEHCHHEHGEHCDHDHEPMDIYIMKVVSDGDNEEFVPVEDDKLDEIIEAIENSYDTDDEDYDDDDFDDYEDEDDQQ